MRPIDADALIAKNCENIEREHHLRVAQLLTNIVNAPTIEVEPVKHGQWEKYDSGETWGSEEFTHWYKCSECDKDAKGRVSEDEWYSYPILSDYCPNCGAKMDLEE